MEKFSLKTFVIIAATAALAVIAIFTAWRLYELRRQAVAPTAPKKVPAAETKSCAPLSFTLVAASTSPTASPTASPSPSPTRSPLPTASSTAAPTAGPTSNPTSSPGATASPTATSVAQATAAPKTTSTVKPTATTAQAQLPQAGVSWPALGAAIGGILLLALGTLLAF